MSYFVPTELGEAIGLMAVRDVNIVAGGTDFYPSRVSGPLPDDILDVTRISGLTGITRVGDGIRIGAATRWSDIVHADLPAAFAGLQAAGREVGSLQIQNAGTIAGNICNASPAADGVPPLLTLGAKVELAGPDGTRQMPLASFIKGPRQTALRAAELVTALHLPLPPSHARGAFEKLGSRKYLVISITMTAVVIGCDASGRIDFARVAVGACSPVALRLTALEDDLLGQIPDAIVVEPHHLAELAPISDVRADAAFRMEAVGEQIRRAVCKAADANG
ncbi:FAD binding domain-containing protein [Paracoccus alkanivorans]|uniref:Xanthine dehydrogenase family protein subunit M n=1 Tax=Paracoccus alkanivorans TaxID=2116655 RepID=A0A3M0MBY7_9RHOB|nr:FAD binding domain-containing protein [Paracoccus alkanivorans]RMC35272.1 xanthine dehydrogenase family protein subunit M [Paracoccus alkanivorans]